MYMVTCNFGGEKGPTLAVLLIFDVLVLDIKKVSFLED